MPSDRKLKDPRLDKAHRLLGQAHKLLGQMPARSEMSRRALQRIRDARVACRLADVELSDAE